MALSNVLLLMAQRIQFHLIQLSGIPKFIKAFIRFFLKCSAKTVFTSESVSSEPSYANIFNKCS